MVIVPFDEIELIYVSNFYDHPLGGVCRYEGKVCRFRREYDTDVAEVWELSRGQRFRAWCRRTSFGICVGWHWHYKDGKRVSWFGVRRPRWFWGAVANLYFRRNPLSYPFFRWKW